MPTTDPCSHLEFVSTDEFVDSVKGLLDAEEIRSLENVLLRNPTAGRVMTGTGGVRKLRLALEGRGKSGGARVLYVYSQQGCQVYFLLAYPKNVRDSLDQGEKNALKVWVKTL